MLFFAMGSAITPQLAKLFLAQRQPLQILTTADNVTEIYSNSSSESRNTTEEFTSNIHHVYSIMGTWSIVACLLNLLSLYSSGCDWRRRVGENPENKPTTTAAAGGGARQKRTIRCFSYSAICSLCSLLFFGIAVEDSFSSFSVTFSVNFLDWTKGGASNLLSGFWISVVVARFLSFVLSNWIQARFLIICMVIPTVTSTLLMALTGSSSPVSMWVGTVLLGLGVGSILGNTLSAGAELISDAGVVSALVISCLYLSRVITPPIMGFLLDHVGYVWFLYACGAYACAMMVSMVVFTMTLHCWRKHNRATVDVKTSSPTDESKESALVEITQQASVELAAVDPEKSLGTCPLTSTKL